MYLEGSRIVCCTAIQIHANERFTGPGCSWVGEHFPADTTVNHHPLDTAIHWIMIY